MRSRFALVVALLVLIPQAAPGADTPAPVAADFVVRDFRFQSGESLGELRIHYHTYGQPRKDSAGAVNNAVLIMHGTTGSGKQFDVPAFAGELFGAGQPLDADKYYIILPDGIGHGQSSKPSDGLRARFPHYGYTDMVNADHALLVDGLKVTHARLVMGTSMGGMHTWVWAERYPDFMDALLPLACLPDQISGRNRWWRKIAADAIRSDPDWKDGQYTSQPQRGLRFAGEMLSFVSSNPRLRYQQAPTLARADDLLEREVERFIQTHDANDVLYALEASHDYDPGPRLESIKAPLLAINFADDLINPPDQGILERQIKRVPHGRAILIPEGPHTRGHGTHTAAAVWKDQLVKFLNETDPCKQAP